MRIAVVGAGISGLTSAYMLGSRHAVTLYECEHRIGGHSHTVDVPGPSGPVPVDTGFIVYNDRTYPNFIRLLTALGLSGEPTKMSFSVRCDRTGLEWGGENLNAMFAQRRNLVRPGFYGMIRDVLRFGREAPADAERAEPGETLGAYLDRRGYGRAFIEHYLIPMGAAIWSMPRAEMRGFPLAFFVRFFENHGMLRPGTRPQWRTIAGGSRRYVRRLLDAGRCEVRAGTPVSRVERDESGVRVATPGGGVERFDAAVIACHSDQALSILADASAAERDVLGAMAYRDNDVVLHTDSSLLPVRRRAWSAWNYRLREGESGGAAVTYCMNILQHIAAPMPLCVSLNQTGSIDPSKVLGRWTYAHPQYTLASLAAQQRHGEISGVRRTHYAGAYWFNGFHEDGVNSALRVCKAIDPEATL